MGEASLGLLRDFSKCILSNQGLSKVMVSENVPQYSKHSSLRAQIHL